MNSLLCVSLLCFWLFFLAFRPILCCCVHIYVATVTPPSFAREAPHVLFPTLGNATSSPVPPRDTEPHFSRDDITDGCLGVTSLRDTVSSGRRTSATPLFGLRAHHGLRPPLGSGLDPSRPTNNLGSSIGQAFQNHLLRPPGQPPPPTAMLVSLLTHHLQLRLYHHPLRSTSTTDEN
jgi:hypothetical protein